MKVQLFAVDANRRNVARLVLAEGVDKTDAELFVLRGGVPGATDIAEGPELASVRESHSRVGAAMAALTGRSQPEPAAEPTYVPGSIEESQARIAAEIAGTPLTLASRLPVVTVPKWDPSKSIVPGTRALSEQQRLTEQKKHPTTTLATSPAPRPVTPIDIKEVPSIEAIEKRINVAINGL